MTVAAVVLAAGESRRLGSPKQLLPWGGTTLLGHVVDMVRSWPVDETWVVLGHVAETIVDRLGPALEGVGIVENPEWEEGLASSLRVGLDVLTRHSRADRALIVLGDQPRVRREVVERLLAEHQRARTMAAVPRYRYTWGNPVVVSRQLWPRLMSLAGDTGAKKLLQAHPDWVTEVWFEQLPPRDIDTVEDVDELSPRSVE